MKAVIMAGGRGTRLHSVAPDIPKPMVSILGKPILEYQIESLRDSGVKQIILVIGYLGHIIQEYFADGEKWNVHISYILEDRPLGTAGALFYLKETIREDFLLVFGDLLLDIDWIRFMDFHKLHGALATMYGHPNGHPYDSDIIVAGQDGRVVKIQYKNQKRDFYYHNFVNAGVYCLNPQVLGILKEPKKTDLEKDVIASQVQCGGVYAYHSTEYVRDMGTPERFQEVLRDIKNGVMAARNLKNKQKAIFLDRDGTINQLRGFLSSPEEFQLIPQVAEGIRKANDSTYLTIIATNQPVIARGECTFDRLEQIHQKMETLLGEKGAYIDDIFFCPHHPHKGYMGEVPGLKFDCECRKPKIGMLLQASRKYNIDLGQSWFIGDTTTDIQTGINAGMRTILLCTGEGGKDGKYQVAADFEADNLLQAIGIVLMDR